MIDAYYVPVEKTKKVEWAGDAKLFDLALYNLGKEFDKFIVVNPAFPNFKFNDDAVLPFINSNRCVVWKYDGMWVAKYFTSEWINEQKYWEIDLNLEWETNPDIDENIIFEDVHITDLYDLSYSMVWYLDKRFNPLTEKMWVKKCHLGLSNAETLGTKDMGYIAPKITYNPALPNLDFTINDHIPYYDLVYEHIWVLDPLVYDEDIWVAKITPTKSEGTKIVGGVQLNLPEQLDVIFISYNEPNAEENWARVREKAPYAKRINGIDGIVNAHKCAAELATTDMFYVVDGDAYLEDNWTFKYQPSIFDRDCVHVWRSRNPVNGLIYGYGGVKLIPRELMLAAEIAGPDMTTSISDKFKVMAKVSNTSMFNTDAFNAWRSGFRECAKLASKTVNRQQAKETEERMKVWCTIGDDKPYGEWAIRGAIAGQEFGKKNSKNLKKLKSINDLKWLKNKFARLPT